MRREEQPPQPSASLAPPPATGGERVKVVPSLAPHKFRALVFAVLVRSADPRLALDLQSVCC